MTSSLIQLVSSASRASSAVSTASFAVWQPAVLGRKRTRPDSRSTRLSSSPARLMRRIEAVTICVPLAATASSIILRFGKPAVPRNSRESNVWPAMTRGSDICKLLTQILLTALARAHDLDTVAGRKPRRRPGGARDHSAVERDRNATLPGVDGFFGQQRLKRRRGERLALAIDADGLVLRHAPTPPPAPVGSARGRTAGSRARSHRRE